MLLKTETQQTFVNGLLGFITLGIYTPAGSVCVLLTIIAWVAHRYGQLLSACSLIYFWVPSSCFCIVDQPLSEGEIIPFSGVCQSGGSCIIHAGGGGGFTQTALMCNRRRPAATSSRRASFSALASTNSFVYFASAQQHHADASCMSVLPRSPASVHLAFFVALGFVGNGVITVMINSPWQADDDADNQSGDNRGDSAHTSISLTVPPASLNFAIRLSALCSNWP